MTLHATHSFLPATEAEAADRLTLHAAQPIRERTFRCGHPDINGHHHLLVTRKPEKLAVAK